MPMVVPWTSGQIADRINSLLLYGVKTTFHPYEPIQIQLTCSYAYQMANSKTSVVSDVNYLLVFFQQLLTEPS